MPRRNLAALFTAFALAGAIAPVDRADADQTQTQTGAPNVDRTRLITRQPFTVQIRVNGLDVTASSPVAEVRYETDGSGSRKLRDGTLVRGRWRFANPQQTQIEVEGPEGTSRWVIVELDDHVYRKVNVDTGVEFIHRPVQQ
jgi:hypothetical protein